MRNVIIAVAIAAAAVAGYLLTRGSSETAQAPVPADQNEPSTEAKQPSSFESRTRPTLPEVPSPQMPSFRRLAGGNRTPERRERREQRRAARRDQFDTNGDGQIDEAERAAMRAARAKRRADRTLESFDSDGDGELDEDETTMRDWARDDRTSDRVARMIRDADTDGDGKLSREEAEAGGRRLRRVVRDFYAVDADSDGSLSAEEVEKAIAARRKHREQREGRAGGGRDINEQE